MLPLHRAINRIERRAHRAAALHRLWDLGPAAVYSGLLHYATGRTKANGQPWDAVGWSKHAFEEIFGARPRPQDRNVEPQSNPAVNEWASVRRHKPKRRAT